MFIENSSPSVFFLYHFFFVFDSLFFLLCREMALQRHHRYTYKILHIDKQITGQGQHIKEDMLHRHSKAISSSLRSSL